MQVGGTPPDIILAYVFGARGLVGEVFGRGNGDSAGWMVDLPAAPREIPFGMASGCRFRNCARLDPSGRHGSNAGRRGTRASADGLRPLADIHAGADRAHQSHPWADFDADSGSGQPTRAGMGEAGLEQLRAGHTRNGPALLRLDG